MGAVTTQFNTAFRDYNTEAVPSSGAREPVKSEIRAIGSAIDGAIAERIGRYATVSAFRAFDAAAFAANNEHVLVMGNLAAGDAPAFLCKWDATNASAHDGINVFRPTVGAAASGNGRWLRVVSAMLKTIANSDATPSVLGARFMVGPSVAAPITDLDDGFEGQEVVFFRGAADLTFVHGAGVIETATGASVTLTLQAPVMAFAHLAGVWRQTSGAARQSAGYAATIAALKTLQGGAFDFVTVGGSAVGGDGWGTQFAWASGSTATANDTTVVLPTGHSGAGRWLAVKTHEARRLAALRKSASSASLFPRKAHPTVAFLSPWVGLPTIEPVIENSGGTPALDVTFYDRLIDEASSLGIESIVYSSVEASGYYDVVISPYITSLDSGQPGDWWRSQIVGSYPQIVDFNRLDAIFRAAERNGLDVIVGLSRDGDINLANDVANVLAGVRPLSNITLSAASGTGVTVTASLATFIAGDVGKIIADPAGAGRLTITGFTSSTVVTGNVTATFSGTSFTAGNWAKRNADPSYGSLTVAQRIARSAAHNRKIAAAIWARYGASPALAGWYIAHEPDHIEGFGPLITEITTASGADPALRTYGLPIMVAPSSPADLTAASVRTCAAYVRAWGVDVIVPQTSYGYGLDLSSGTLGYFGGQATNLTQTPAHLDLWRELVTSANAAPMSSAAGLRIWSHAELWERASGSDGNGRPVDGAEVESQWKAAAAHVERGVIYQIAGWLHDSTWALRPRQNSNTYTDFRTRAEALLTSLRPAFANRRARLAAAIARPPAIERQYRLAPASPLSVFGGAYNIDVTPSPTTSYEPASDASEVEVEMILHVETQTADGASTAYCSWQMRLGGSNVGPVQRTYTGDRPGGCTVVLKHRLQPQGAAFSIQVAADNQEFAGTWLIRDAVVTVREFL